MFCSLFALFIWTFGLKEKSRNQKRANGQLAGGIAAVLRRCCWTGTTRLTFVSEMRPKRANVVQPGMLIKSQRGRRDFFHEGRGL